MILPFNCYQLSMFHLNVSVWLFHVCIHSVWYSLFHSIILFEFSIKLLYIFIHSIWIFHIILHLNYPYDSSVLITTHVWLFHLNIPFALFIVFHIDIPYKLSIWIVNMNYPLDNNFIFIFHLIILLEFSIRLYYYSSIWIFHLNSPGKLSIEFSKLSTTFRLILPFDFMYCFSTWIIRIDFPYKFSKLLTTFILIFHLNSQLKLSMQIFHINFPNC